MTCLALLSSEDCSLGEAHAHAACHVFRLCPNAVDCFRCYIGAANTCKEGSVGAPSMHAVQLVLNPAMLTSVVSRSTNSQTGSWLCEYTVMLELTDDLLTCFEQLKCPAGLSGLAEPDLAVPAC